MTEYKVYVVRIISEKGKGRKTRLKTSSDLKLNQKKFLPTA